MLVNIDVNLAYDPASGLNYPFTNIGRRPYPKPDRLVEPREVHGGQRS